MTSGVGISKLTTVPTDISLLNGIVALNKLCSNIDNNACLSKSPESLYSCPCCCVICLPSDASTNFASSEKELVIFTLYNIFESYDWSGGKSTNSSDISGLCVDETNSLALNVVS